MFRKRKEVKRTLKIGKIDRNLVNKKEIGSPVVFKDACENEIDTV